MKILLEYLITVVLPLDELHLPLAILRTDQLVIDHADPAFPRRERTDQAAPKMRFGRGLMELVHGMEIIQHPRNSGEDIVYFEVLFGGIPFGHTKIRPAVDHHRIDDLVVMTAVALDLARHERQGGQGKIPIPYIYQPLPPVELYQQGHMFELPAIFVIAVMQPAGDHGDVKTAGSQEVMKKQVQLITVTTPVVMDDLLI